jgi:hypothetical protein
MLVAMRKHMKTIFIVIIILIVPAFVFFYVPQAIRQARGGPKYGEIFGKGIRQPEFFDAVRAQLRAVGDLRYALISMEYRQPQYAFLRAQRELYLARLGPAPSLTPPERAREQVRLQFTDPETEDYDTRLRELGMTDEEYVSEFSENLQIIQSFIDPMLRGGGEQGWQYQRREAWDRIMLAHEARRLGIGVSDQEVVNYLYLIAGRDGDIDDDRYTLRLRQADKSRKEYEDEVRTTIRVAKLQQFVLDSVKAPRQEVVEQFDERYREYKLAYHLEPSDDYIDPGAVRDDEAEAFYAKQRSWYTYLDQFIIKPQASVMYVLVETVDFMDAVELDEEQVTAYYDSHKTDFKGAGGAVRAYAACADDVRAAVRTIEAIKLAREEATRRFLVSQPQALIQNAARYTRPDGQRYVLHTTPLFGQEGEIDGVIGADEEWFRKEVFGPMPEYVQLRPKPGVVLGPVRVAQGWCVLALIQMVPDASPRMLPREQWLGIARNALARQRAADLAREVTDDQSKQVQALMKEEAVGFEEACRRLGLDVQETAFFTGEDEEVPGLEHSGALIGLAQSVHESASYGEGEPHEVLTQRLDENAGAVLVALLETRLPDKQTVARNESRFTQAVVERTLRANAYYEWYLALHDDAGIVDLEQQKRIEELKAQQQARGAGGR